MSAFHGHLSGVVTLVLLVTFLAIWIWAWQPWHRSSFDRLARLPLDDLDGSDAGSVSPSPSRAGAATKGTRA